eukprot:2272907-Rhodomonas_salina.2
MSLAPLCIASYPAPYYHGASAIAIMDRSLARLCSPLDLQHHRYQPRAPLRHQVHFVPGSQLNGVDVVVELGIACHVTYYLPPAGCDVRVHGHVTSSTRTTTTSRTSGTPAFCSPGQCPGQIKGKRPRAWPKPAPIPRDDDLYHDRSNHSMDRQV